MKVQVQDLALPDLLVSKKFTMPKLSKETFQILLLLILLIKIKKDKN